MVSESVGEEKNFIDSRAGRFLAANWAACFLVLMLIVFSFTGRNFLSVVNFQNVVHLQTVAFLLASVGAAKLMQLFLAAGMGVGWTIAASVLIVLVASLLLGLINGIVITKFKVPPFIATLGMYGIANGIALKISQGYPMTGLPDVLPSIGNRYFLYVHPGDFFSFFAKPAYFADNHVRELLRIVPLSLPFILIVLAILSFTLRRRRFGRHTYARVGPARR